MIRRLQSNGNKTNRLLEIELSIKELELTSLLEVTQAINANLPEAALYKIFHFTLIANLYIPKLAMFVLDKDWCCKVSYNTKADYKNKVLNKKVTAISNVTFLSDNILDYEEFEIVIPIAHKSKVLAYVLVGGLQDAEAFLDTSNISFIQTITSIVIVAIENKKLARKELQQEAFRKEMEIAREVQHMLFPKELPYNERVKVHATYLPHQSIGGDYYDYIPLDQHTYMVCIADVSGKGVPAALLMSNFQACLRTLTRQTQDLKQIVEELNHCIITNAKGERYITFFVAICDTEKNTIRFINAGHNPSYLIDEEGEIQILEEGTTILGAFPQLPFIQEGNCRYTKNSLLFSFTDGITETFNMAEEEFGIDRITHFLKSENRMDLKQLHLSMKTVLDTYRGEQSFTDDITFLSCLLF